ncbi:mandelamide amidase [Roseibium hamelinense]|uniref:Mandelamide amidase n=1 Tax=Roseibium hamelinense TaxID=150831 RepID=A0A562SKN9_9HYPH|nr:indoleacetamide hydrolase [Roseibium hamelinense]MTI43239.1 indoleacetamide hydrolase [Roseibium hamelinense]TWI81835.1 mandelamide amidase [Roseibium hamelinense]
MRCVIRTVFAGALLGLASAAHADTGLVQKTASELALEIRTHKTTSVEVVKAFLDAIGNDERNAFITLDSEGALMAALAADQALNSGGAIGPLHGVPIVIKDNIAARGLPTTAGTSALSSWVPQIDASVVSRLRNAGAIVLGKTNMHELAFGITSNNATFGAVGNAYDPAMTAGGSSGGTGLAVGARYAPAGLGTDTGGSVRIPAALNGVAGFRPSVGRYPLSGIVPISTTRDTAGPIARSLTDLVLLDGVLAGAQVTSDPADLKLLRIGVPEGLADSVGPETARLFESALDKLTSRGAKLVSVDLSAIHEINDQVSFPIVLWEVRRDLARFLNAYETGLTIEAVTKGIESPDVKFVFEELVLGEKAIPDAVYQTVIRDLRPKLQAAYGELFAKNRLDALAFPTTPLEAQPIETSDLTVDLNGEKVETFATYIRHTDPGSNAGIPGLSLPIGLTSGGLPVGLELDGPAFSDRHLLSIGLAVEAAIPALPAPRR